MYIRPTSYVTFRQLSLYDRPTLRLTITFVPKIKYVAIGYALCVFFLRDKIPFLHTEHVGDCAANFREHFATLC